MRLAPLFGAGPLVVLQVSRTACEKSFVLMAKSRRVSPSAPLRLVNVLTEKLSLRQNLDTRIAPLAQHLMSGCVKPAPDKEEFMNTRNALFTTMLLGGAAMYGHCAAQRAKAAQREKEFESDARRRVEEALKKAETGTMELMSAIPSLMIAVDVEGRITHWTRASRDTLRLAEADALGRTLAECDIQWTLPEPLRCVDLSRFSGEFVRLDDIKFTRADGREGLLGITLYPLKKDGGATAGLLILGADVSERRLQERQLRQSQKLESIGQLAAGIAHEINTPTQYVGDNTRFLEDAFGDLRKVLEKCGEVNEAGRAGSVSPDLLAELAETMSGADVEYLAAEMPKAIQQSLDGIERITKIVQSMKDFAHPDTGEKKVVDLNNAIESTITVSRNEWKYVADLKTDFDPELPPVPCLLGEFNQVILNMIINAAHAIADVTEDGARGMGAITIATRADGEWAEISVADTGMGIPAEHVARIFDPFFTTKKVGKGTGQGLAISHHVIVDKHGGQIACETEEGRGTTFRIRLPFSETSSQQSRREAA
jgi:signal transduction histidine kinase